MRFIARTLGRTLQSVGGCGMLMLAIFLIGVVFSGDLRGTGPLEGLKILLVALTVALTYYGGGRLRAYGADPKADWRWDALAAGVIVAGACALLAVTAVRQLAEIRSRARAADGMKNADPASFQDSDYVRDVRSIIRRKWQADLPGKKAACVVVFSLQRDGSLRDLRVEESSRDPDFDAAALDRVRASAPFPPLPAGFPEPFCVIHLLLST